MNVIFASPSPAALITAAASDSARRRCCLSSCQTDGRFFYERSDRAMIDADEVAPNREVNSL